MNSRNDDMRRIEAMVAEIRSIRDRRCTVKANTNPRYLALSSAVSNLNKVADELRQED